MSSRLPPTLRYVAWVAVGLLHRAHDLIDYTMGPAVVRLDQPLELISAPGTIVGWAVWGDIEDRFAPVLPAPFEALAPAGASDIEPIAALYHIRYADPAKTQPVAGYAVTEMRRGGWQPTPVGTRDEWLAALGLRVAVGIDDELVFAARDAEPVSGLTVSAMRALMQARYDELQAATSATPAQLRALHGQAQALAEYLAGALA